MIGQAIILAGGLGTRLGDLTRDIPKPLLPVGGTPFLALLVEEVRRHGICDILILAGFKGEQVAAAFAGMQDARVLIEPSPMGTGGALRLIAPDLADRFLFLNGDSWFDINLLDLAAIDPKATATLAVRRVENASRYGAVTLEGNAIHSFKERSSTAEPGLINGGVAILHRNIVDALPSEGSVSIEADIYPVLAKAGRMAGRVYDRPFIDIGIPKDFARAQAYIPAIRRRGAVIFDRDGVLNEDVGYAHRPDHIRWVPGAIDAIKTVNDAGLYAFVATNQAGVARGYYGEEEVHSLHRWMNAQLGRRGAHIDAFAYSPYHPDGVIERYSRVSDCRKPAPGMLLRLMEDHDVDRNRVVMIGDKLSDIEAATAAGVAAVLFEGADLNSVVNDVVNQISAAPA